MVALFKGVVSRTLIMWGIRIAVVSPELKQLIKAFESYLEAECRRLQRGMR